MSLRNIAYSLIGMSMCVLSSAAVAQEAKPIRVGIIGLDTSHVTAFTKILNDPKAEGDLAGVRIVAAYPGGSPDIPSSADRVEGFTKTLRDAGVEIVAMDCDARPGALRINRPVPVLLERD